MDVLARPSANTGFDQTSTTMAPSPSQTANSFRTFVSDPSHYSSSVPTNGSTPRPQETQDTGNLTRFAFFFLIVFIAFLFFGFWVVHRNRMGRKVISRGSGQDALARDLDGWVNSRRWVNGAWRTDPAHTRDDEGLDERGEAPPPYQGQGEPPPPPRTANECGYTIDHDSDGANAGSCSAYHAPSLTIPLRTLSQSGRNLKPPDYHEIVGAVGGEASTSPIAEPPPVAITHHLPLRPSANL